MGAASSKELRRRVHELEQRLQDHEQLKRDHAALQKEHKALKSLHGGGGGVGVVVGGSPLKPTSVASPVSKATGKPEQLNLADVPQVGDHVLSYHHPTTAFYFSTVVNFDLETYEYTVNWDDGDPTGRTMMYDRVALDLVPKPSDIAEGTIVIFPQGHYVGTEGSNTGGTRYHRGVVTRVYKDADGVTRYDGHHAETPESGDKHRFRSYVYEFTGMTLSDLRLSPNVLNIIMNERSKQGSNDPQGTQSYDVFLTYAKEDSQLAVMAGEVPNASELPPPYDLDGRMHCDPRTIAQRLREAGFKVWLDCDQPADFGYADVVSAISNSSVIVACVSNAFALSADNRQQFQFARDKLKKPIIPVVVETCQRGPPWDWQHTVVGLLLVGELYIDFTSNHDTEQDMQGVVDVVRKKIAGDQQQEQQRVESHQQALSKTTDIFVSYCWSNSWDAKLAGQIGKFVGAEHHDPRMHAGNFKENISQDIWLDVWRLESGNEAAGMFEQIASGLKTTKLVVAFISTEYAKSDNCRMEIQFAAKSLRKPILPVIIGEGDEWRETVVGMLVAGLHIDPISLTAVPDSRLTPEILKRAREMLADLKPSSTTKPTLPPAAAENEDDSDDAEEEEEEVQAEGHVAVATSGPVQFRAPRPGDHVLSYHHPTTAYYLSTIESFDRSTFEYTVCWDDGDPSGRTMSYDRVALDATPDADEIAVGSTVIFRQGRYIGTEGNNSGGYRYHQGIIDRIYEEDGVTKYDGHHAMTPEEGKHRFRAYVYEFVGHTRQELRMSPNAMDALMACQQL